MDKKRVFVHATGKYLPPGVLMIVASLSPWPALSQTVHDGGTVIESFLAPDAHEKPTARMWFPDASAGEDNDAYDENQVAAVAAQGVGGVEVGLISAYGWRE